MGTLRRVNPNFNIREILGGIGHLDSQKEVLKSEYLIV